MGIIVDLNQLMPCGIFSSKYDEILAWLEECLGPRIFPRAPTPDKNGIIPISQSSNWRIINVTYALRRANPDANIPKGGVVLELDSDSDYLMFKFRWL